MKELTDKMLKRAHDHLEALRKIMGWDVLFLNDDDGKPQGVIVAVPEIVAAYDAQLEEVG